MTDTETRVHTLLEKVRTDPEPADADRLLAFFDADDPAVRRRAVEGVRVLGGYDRTFLAYAVDDFVERLDDPADQIRVDATAALGDLGEVDPDPYRDAADALAACLADDFSLVRWNALEALFHLTRSAPEAVRPHVEAIRPFLDAEAEHVREHALVSLAAVAPDRPAFVEALREPEVDVAGVPTRDGDPAPQLQDVREEQFARQRTRRRTAGRAIVAVARDDPDAVVPCADTLADRLTDRDPRVAVAAADTLFALADADPAVVRPHIDALAGRLDADAPADVRTSALRVLAVASPDTPSAVRDAVAPAVDILRDCLHDEEPAVHASAATLLALLADDDPDIVEPVTARLRALRETGDEPYVRAAAADALEAGRGV
ncbi:HEAT repeat domain-containing protein [Halarchaeum sp. P4]|uniref:HEAT repeat domain-containing protein n=1 Tax=Halarchaeum sp. P4 TaxID=3421639 RepID=UPI003EBF3922